MTACTVDVSQLSPSNPLAAQSDDRNSSSVAPVTWKSLNLQGKLVYITSHIGSSSGGMATPGLQTLDLESGDVQTIFDPPQGAWIDFVSPSPSGEGLALEYIPSGNDLEAVNPGQQAIYTIPSDGSEPPKLVLRPPSDSDLYYHPTWSPDGKYIYFSHVNYKARYTLIGQTFPDYEIFRMKYPDGQPERLADQAFWPRLSEDGSRLAYVSFDPVDGSNQLFVAGADGSGQRQILMVGSYVPTIIDAPSFSPDNKLIYFSAASPLKSFSPSWVDRIFGIPVASAHVVQSDWWSVPIGGGTPTQLTRIAAVGLYAGLSPDRKYIVSYSGDGLFLMNPDGTGATILLGDLGGLAGTVSWIP